MSTSSSATRNTLLPQPRQTDRADALQAAGERQRPCGPDWCAPAPTAIWWLATAFTEMDRVISSAGALVALLRPPNNYRDDA